MRIVIVCLLIASVSCFPRHEEDEARVLSEVWDAMEKHHGDDIIVIPRHDGPGSEHHSEHHGPSSHDGPSHDGPSHEGSSHEESKDRSESERSSESSSETPKSESADTSAAESSGPSEHSDESSREHHGREGSEENSERIWDKFNRIGDMMNRAVERLRQDDREFREIEGESSSGSGLTVFILEIVGAVVVGLIVVSLLVVGLVKGLKGLKSWKARRQSERLVDQEAPNMDGTGYQSGYNP